MVTAQQKKILVIEDDEDIRTVVTTRLRRAGYATTIAADGKDGPKNKLEAESTIVLDNSGGTETIEIHTSCSQPLQVGNVFGNLTVTDIGLIPK